MSHRPVCSWCWSLLAAHRTARRQLAAEWCSVVGSESFELRRKGRRQQAFALVGFGSTDYCRTDRLWMVVRYSAGCQTSFHPEAGLSERCCYQKDRHSAEVETSMRHRRKDLRLAVIHCMVLASFLDPVRQVRLGSHIGSAKRPHIINGRLCNRR